MNGTKEEKIVLDENLLLGPAERILEILNDAFADGRLDNLGSRGGILLWTIGGLNGHMTKLKSSRSLQERLADVVDMFDQADTGNAIKDKPGGIRLRREIEKLREVLNQKGKITILTADQINDSIKEITKVREEQQRFIEENCHCS